MRFVKLFSLGVIALSAWSFDKAMTPIQTDTPVPKTEPPKTWTEHWFQHKLVLSRAYYDDHVVMYYDDGMNKAVTWPYRIMSDAWAYVNKTYGTFGESYKSL
jgi:hypothetical protein